MNEETEVFIREDEAWILDGDALCKRFDGLYVYRYEGTLFMGIPGRGEIAVDTLLIEEGKAKRQPRGAVVPITGNRVPDKVTE